MKDITCSNIGRMQFSFVSEVVINSCGLNCTYCTTKFRNNYVQLTIPYDKCEPLYYNYFLLHWCEIASEKIGRGGPEIIRVDAQGCGFKMYKLFSRNVHAHHIIETSTLSTRVRRLSYVTDHGIAHNIIWSDFREQKSFY